MKRRILTTLAIFLIFSSVFVSSFAATNEGYGEDQTSLGQFVDSFEDLNNVSVRFQVERNATLEAMELNYTTGVGGYGNFTNYIEFDVDYNRVNSNLTDFPILLEISDSSGIDNQDLTFIFDEIGASYLKIAVTNTSNLDEHYIEVERWDAIQELGILWIAPDVSSLENTTLRLHFDSGVDNNTVYVGLPGSAVASNVWDAGFASVWHMGTGTGNEVDSTGNGNTATEVGTVLQASGQIGYAREFLGSDDHFHFADADLGIGAGQFTYEAWFNQYGGGYGRIIYTYDPTSGIYISTGGQLGGSYEIHAVIFVSGSAVTLLSATGRSYNDGTWYYVTFTRDVISLELDVDAIQVDTGNLAGSIDGGGHGHIGNDISHTVEFEGYIDEVRVSTTLRSTDWRNASYISGMDDLIYWDNSIITPAGYVDDGYFTTVDYLSDPLANGSALTALTNTSIPANTQILLEFSEDNITWVLNDWQPLFGGFEAVDLRDLNYSAGYHCRFNLSTTDSSVTPRVYQNRLITTIGTGGITINQTINRLNGTWVHYNLSAIAIVVGVHDAGNVASTYFIDSDEWNCSEVAGIPGYQINFNVTGIDTEAISLYAEIWMYYDGANNHIINVDFWNFTSMAWVTLGQIPDMMGYEWQNHTIWGLHDPDHFLNSSGAIVGRLRHVSNGNINDDISIDSFQILAFVPTGLASAPAAEEFQYFWIVLAIALMLIGILISKMWFEGGDP